MLGELDEQNPNFLIRTLYAFKKPVVAKNMPMDTGSIMREPPDIG